ncbi:MAG: sulfatase-like hydrolase/transferase [Planctomycetes bacterium]|nr:sulfatase-like hydrolase/transferase [Planctomycetota bacterium]
MLPARAIALPALLVAAAACPAAEPRPNVLWILADDLGYECLGSSGGTSYRTPSLDSLARGGMRFTRCFATPLCTPTRLALLTGRYGFRTGQRWGVLPEGEVTVANVLRDAGYDAAAAGKWQLAKFQEEPEHPRASGFDRHCLWTWSWDGKRPSRYWDPSIWQDGKLLEGAGGRYGPDLYCEYLIRFLREHAPGAAEGRPFFAFYPMCLVHAPFDRVPGRAPAGYERMTAQERFADMVEHMDRLVGRLVAALDELGLRERTLVLFTGDNGTPRGITSRHGGRDVQGGKGLFTDAGTHVPLIASWPGRVPAGAVSDDLVDASDFLPTIAELAGARLPPVPIDGRSFLPRLLGKPFAPREHVYIEWDGTWCLRDARWKLFGDGRLFDLAADPEEARPIARGAGGSAEEAAERARLRAELDRLRGGALRTGRPWRRYAIDDASRGADGVRSGDLDGDGRLDVATGWEEGGVVRVCLQPGPQDVRRKWPAVTVGKVPSVEDAAIADLDSDGAAEVVSAAEGATRGVFIHRLAADRTRLLEPEAWRTEPISAARDRMQWMFLLPMQVDGRGGVDLVAGGKGRGGAIGWLEAPGDPPRLEDWRWHELRAAGWVMSLVASDVDLDGDLDVLATDRKGERRGGFWLECPGPDRAADGPWREHALGPGGLGDREAMFLAEGDLDSDGLRDVLVAAKPREVLWLRRASRDGASWEARSIPLPPSAGTAKAVAVGDLDLDGLQDIAFTCEEARGELEGVGWLAQRGGKPGEPSAWDARGLSGSEGAKLDLVELRDLDGDGDLDALTTEEADGLGVVWYENPVR